MHKNKKSSALFSLPPFFVYSESDIIHINDDRVSDSLLATQNDN